VQRVASSEEGNECYFGARIKGMSLGDGIESGRKVNICLNTCKCDRVIFMSDVTLQTQVYRLGSF
jgi:hypothetical protein